MPTSKVPSGVVVIMDDNKLLPSDYEACGVCGWDHTYDLPYVSASERELAEMLHDARGAGADLTCKKNCPGCKCKPSNG